MLLLEAEEKTVEQLGIEDGTQILIEGDLAPLLIDANDELIFLSSWLSFTETNASDRILSDLSLISTCWMMPIWHLAVCNSVSDC